MDEKLEKARIVILTEESRQRLLALGDELVKELSFLRMCNEETTDQDTPVQIP